MTRAGARRRHAAERKFACPTPSKALFRTHALADASRVAIGSLAHPANCPHHAYECVCGFWHLTRRSE